MLPPSMPPVDLALLGISVVFDSVGSPIISGQEGRIGVERLDIPRDGGAPLLVSEERMSFWGAAYSGMSTEELMDAIRSERVYGLNEEDVVVSSNEQIGLREDVQMSITPYEWALRRDNCELAELIKKYAALERKPRTFWELPLLPPSCNIF